VLALVLVPDPGDVPQDAERHERVVAALVLDQDVHERVLPVERRGEQDIGVPPFQGLVNEAARDRGQLGQVQPGRDARGQDRAQLGRGVGGHGEDPAEHRVMRGGHPARLPTAGFRPGRGRRAATGIRLICHAPHRTGPHRHSAAAQRSREDLQQPGTAIPAPAASAPPGALSDRTLPGLVDVFEENPAAEAATLGTLAVRFRHDVFPGHLVGCGQGFEYFQYISQL